MGCLAPPSRPRPGGAGGSVPAGEGAPDGGHISQWRLMRRDRVIFLHGLQTNEVNRKWMATFSSERPKAQGASHRPSGSGEHRRPSQPPPTPTPGHGPQQRAGGRVAQERGDRWAAGGRRVCVRGAGLSVPLVQLEARDSEGKHQSFKRLGSLASPCHWQSPGARWKLFLLQLS